MNYDSFGATVKISDEEAKKIDGVLNSLSATSSRKEKEVILKSNVSYAPLWYVFREALNPYYNYFNAGERIISEEQSDKIKGFLINDILKRIHSNEINLNTDDGIKLFSSMYWGLSFESRKILKSIVDKDMRVGVGAKTLNKVKPAIIPIIPYMRCSLPNQVPFESVDWSSALIQEKCDGAFTNINNYADKAELELYTRTGMKYDPSLLFDDETRAILSIALLSDHQSHGEMLIVDKKTGEVLPREKGNGILNSALSGSKVPDEYRVKMVIWDSVPLDYALTGTEYKVAYKDRFAKLLSQYKAALVHFAQHHSESEPLLVEHLEIVKTELVKSFDDAQNFYRKMLNQGKEGAIIKLFSGTWKDGTSKAQIKMKLSVDCDLKIVGYEEGKGKFENNVGSIVCATSDDMLQVSVSGFDDATRSFINEHRNEFLNSIVTVRFNSIMEPEEEGGKYSLFLPRFVEFRKDKTEADDLQRVRDQFENAIRSV